MVAQRQLPETVAQAAAWHLDDEMSWQQLARLKYDRVGVPDTPHFSYAQLVAAQHLVAAAKANAHKSQQSQDDDSPAPAPRFSRVRTVR